MVDYFLVNRAISSGSHDCFLGFFRSPLSLGQSSSLSHGIKGRLSDTALLLSAIPSKQASKHSPSLGVLNFRTTPCLLPLRAPVRTRVPTLPDSPGPCFLSSLPICPASLLIPHQPREVQPVLFQPPWLTKYSALVVLELHL